MNSSVKIPPGRGALALLCLGLGACGASTSAGSPTNGWSDAGTGPGRSGGSSGGFSNGSGGASGTGGAGDPLPPEQEVESSYEVPVATGRFVWIANPLSGRVAFVDAMTLKVRTAEAGNAPTYLAPIPGAADAVVVLNVLSHDATVLRAEGASAQLRSTLVAGIAPLANAWAVSPDGKFALAWTDARRALAAAPRTGSLEGFQDVSVIDLGAAPPVATTVAVGYRPVSVAFSADGKRAFAVTQDGVSVIGLPGPNGSVQVIRDVPLTENPTENADTRDVSITRDGRAVVRREGSAEVRIVDLATAATSVVTLTGPVTDLDVTADGTRAIAVVRLTAQVAIIPLGATAEQSTVLSTIIDGERIGSVTLTGDGKQALLYSNAAESERVIALDLATAERRVLRVHAPVLSLFPSADGAFAVVLHQQPPAGAGGAGGTTTGAGGAGAGSGGAPVAKPPVVAAAFSVVPLDGSRAGRIQETVALPQAVAIAPNSTQALITVRDDRAQTFAVYQVGLPGLQVTRLDLASPPISTGVVAAAARGYVAQRHPEGRITFIPFGTGVPQTLTGFDLGARVVDGVTQ
jgi:hypothetical protein